jgi:tRNA (cmo5U34)-methyltransferase
MQNQEPTILFDQKRASSYDTQYAKLAPLRDALHLLTRVILSDLPTEAQVLCVGVGTGAELLDLAGAFPQWQFTALEPAAPMLDICRRRAEENGIASRCTFHEGYLDTLPEAPPFDAATSILVSHFLVQPEARRDFYSRIAARLRPEGCLISADLVSADSTAAYQSLFDVWMRMQRYTDIPAAQLEKMRVSYGKEFAAQSPQEVEAMIASSGFDAPVLFLQTLLIHAWYAKRTSAARDIR